MNIPWVSQVVGPGAEQNANECGLACVMALSRWMGQAWNVTIDAMSREMPARREFDPNDDGTTSDDLVKAFKKFGLTGIKGDRRYPYIALGWYSRLPEGMRWKKNVDFLHWIIRTGPGTFMDPYYDTSVGASLTATEAQLDNFVSSTVGMAERPAETSQPSEELVTVVSDAAYLSLRSIPTTLNNTPLAYIKNGASILAGERMQDERGRSWRKVITTVPGTFRTPALVDPYKVQTGWAAEWLLSTGAAPPPPPPVAPLTRQKVGLHCRGDVEVAKAALAAGCRAVTVMDNFQYAREAATQYPDAVVIHRKYLHDWKPDGATLASWMEPCGGKVWLALINECDNYCYGTRAEMEARAKVEIEAAKRLLDRGEKVLIGGWSQGCPNVLDEGIVEVLQSMYAPLYNQDTEGRVGLDFHLYSPYMGHMQGGVQRATVRPDSNTWIRVIEQAGRDKIQVSKLIPSPIDLRGGMVPNYSIDISDDRVWFEGRYLWFYCEFGFRLDRGAGAFASEHGKDTGGQGGFALPGIAGQDILDWCAAALAYHTRPLLIGGKQYPNPLRALTIFQGSQAPGWATYYVPHGLLANFWKQ